MPKSTTTCNNLLKLIFNAVAWANMADNAAATADKARCRLATPATASG